MVTEMLTSALHAPQIDVHSEQLGQLKTFLPLSILQPFCKRLLTLKCCCSFISFMQKNFQVAQIICDSFLNLTTLPKAN